MGSQLVGSDNSYTLPTWVCIHYSKLQTNHNLCEHIGGGGGCIVKTTGKLSNMFLYLLAFSNSVALTF